MVRSQEWREGHCWVQQLERHHWDKAQGHNARQGVRRRRFGCVSWLVLKWKGERMMYPDAMSMRMVALMIDELNECRYLICDRRP